MRTRLAHTPRAETAHGHSFPPLTPPLPRHSDRFILLDVGALLKLLSEEAGAEDIDANDVDLEARHINEQKIEKLCGLTAKASLVVGLYVDKFPPPPRQLILAERLSAGGFWLSSKKRWVTGLNLLPLGSVHRLPLPEGAPPDTLLTGRALPVTLSSPPVSSQQLRKAMIKRRNLTADQVRQHVAEGRHVTPHLTPQISHPTFPVYRCASTSPRGGTTRSTRATPPASCGCTASSPARAARATSGSCCASSSRRSR